MPVLCVVLQIEATPLLCLLDRQSVNIYKYFLFLYSVVAGDNMELFL